jgi:hypothetical protein
MGDVGRDAEPGEVHACSALTIVGDVGVAAVVEHVARADSVAAMPSATERIAREPVQADCRDVRRGPFRAFGLPARDVEDRRALRRMWGIAAAHTTGAVRSAEYRFPRRS